MASSNLGGKTSVCETPNCWLAIGTFDDEPLNLIWRSNIGQYVRGLFDTISREINLRMIN